MNKHPIVSIGMPLYKSESYFDFAVKSILDQTYQNFEVRFSIDNNDTTTAKQCEKYLHDERFAMHVHHKHLGWLKNIEWLMKNQSGDYWFYFQQDDLLDRDYIKKLLRYIKTVDNPAVVYSDIQSFGYHHDITKQESIVGSPFQREIFLIRDHLPAVAFRGLIPKEVVDKITSTKLRGNHMDNFCSDTTWMATIARYGNMYRLPEVLYKKRYHKKNVHTQWKKNIHSLEKAWIVHCHDMYKEALPTVENMSQYYKLIKAVYYRLFRSPIREIYFKNEHWSNLKRKLLSLQFIIYALTHFV